MTSPEIIKLRKNFEEAGRGSKTYAATSWTELLGLTGLILEVNKVIGFTDS
jgi:hypothetical protein